MRDLTDAEKIALHTARVFSTPDGQAVLDDLRKSFQRRNSFVSGDPYATAFREGQRDVLNRFDDLIEEAERIMSEPSDQEDIPSE